MAKNTKAKDGVWVIRDKNTCLVLKVCLSRSDARAIKQDMKGIREAAHLEGDLVISHEFLSR